MAEKGANSALALELVEAFNAGDMERFAARLTDDAEIRTFRSELEGSAYIGPDGFRKALDDWDKEWESGHFVVDGSEERDRFVVLDLRVQAKGKASGIELDVPVWMLLEFEGGRIKLLQSYSDRAEAQGAAGIED